MKSLRKTIRNLILEDLGKKLFAPFAAIGHPHHGDEPNTDEEELFMNELWTYIVYNDDSSMGEDFGERYAEYAKNPLYSDVLKVMQPGTMLYRGMLVPKEQLEYQIFGEDENEFIPAGKLSPDKVYSILENTEYEHYDWRHNADQLLSSWTTDINSAILFSSGGETTQQRHAKIPAVFIAKTGGFNTEKFLDFRNLYDYKGLEPKRNEQEIVGWGMLELSKIYVGNF